MKKEPSRAGFMRQVSGQRILFTETRNPKPETSPGLVRAAHHANSRSRTLFGRGLPTGKTAILALSALAFAIPGAAAGESSDSELSVLVFSKTAGFRHASIPDGIQAFRDLGEKHGFKVTATEDAAIFTDETLADFSVVVFLNTTGTLFDESQRQALKNFIRGGGGWAGIHSAADTEYDWPWYGRLAGAYFQSHPRIQEAAIDVEDRDHPSTRHLPREWVRTDEWYNFRANPREEVRVLASLRTDTFEGSTMPEDHPIAWCREFEGGRAWYTGGGHTSESFSEEKFLAHLLGGVRWAAGMED